MNGFGPALTLARREFRSGLKGFRIMLACLILGVMAIAAVGSTSESIRSGLMRDGTALLGGDLDIRLVQRPAKPEQLKTLQSTTRAFSATADMRAMANDGKEAFRLVEMKAVDQAYPLVGEMKLDPDMSLIDALAVKNGIPGAVADKNLLPRLGLKLGDKVHVGGQTFELRATIEKEPDRVANVLNFGPRLMIGLEQLNATGLIQPGSQVHFHYRVQVNPGKTPQTFKDHLKSTHPQAGWRVRDAADAAPNVQRFVDRMTLFLSFVGLTALLIGGIGIGNAVESYLERKTATIATLKCLGAPSRLIFSAYLLQILGLGLIGIFSGLILGAVLPYFGAHLMAGLLPAAPEPALYPATLALAGVFGVLTTITFALWPLLKGRSVPASQLFRDRIVTVSLWRSPGSLAIVALFFAALAVLTLLTATDQYFAYWFVGGTTLALLLLKLGAKGATTLAKRLKQTQISAEWRLGIANIHRPGNRTSGIMLSLGLGLSVLVAIALIDGNLRHQIAETLPEQAPAFFFVDIQNHQAKEFDATISKVAAGNEYKRVASLRGRIVEINGVPVDKATIAPESMWAIRGDRALTYAVHKPEGTKMVAGNWWPENYAGAPRISLDAGLAKGFGIGLGDTLTLNVLGRDVTAEVTSLRAIDWRSLRFDFAIIFAPGTLEGAPHSHLAAIHANAETEDSIERAVTRSFANVSVIRVREALQSVHDLIAGIGTGVRASSLLTLAVGALVLAGAIAAGHRRQVYDAVVFKVLGANRSAILKAYMVEYGVLGLTTGLLSGFIGTAIAWAVIVFLMRSPWVNLPEVTFMTISFCLAITLGGGFIGTWRALGRKSAPLLRNE